MEEERKKHWYHRRSTTLVGPIWFIGWLFTIGYANLEWWQVILAIVVWPYFLGRAVGG
ncbi:MAG TPA: hypothetical protein VIH69_03495 [Dehalococcoidia bacterium]